MSSQAWKHAVRDKFETELDDSDLGMRTRHVVEVLDRRIRERAPELADRAEELAKATFKAVGIKTSAAKKEEPEQSGYLVFLSSRQYDNLADAAASAARAGGNLDKALKERDVKALADREHSIDVALFGRMVADVSDINVEAAAQVAHAISVHAVDNEYDYFTAVDDHDEDEERTGAGMIGTVEFNSATLYRYAAVDVDRLAETLGSPEAAQRAVEAFARTFVTSMPTGKITTFGNRTLPDAVLVRLRETQPISFVGAFEEPVTAGTSAGRLSQAAIRLAEYAVEVERKYDQPPAASWVVHVGRATEALAGLGQDGTLDELVKGVGDEVAQRLAGTA